MEWLLITVIFLLLAVNIKLMLSFKKHQTEQVPAGIHESMTEFVAQLEKENKELYDKLLAHINVGESNLAERVKLLEKNLASKFEELPEIACMETEKITQLSKQGFSSKQIAKVLQADHSKVELVVNMNYKRQENYKEDEVL